MKYVVKNRSASAVVYSIPEDGIRREFAPGEMKRIDVEELEKLTYQPGGLTMLARFLQIQDPSLTQEFGIHTEPEYFMSESDVVDLIKNGSVDAFLDALDFAPTGVIDLIKKLSVTIPLTDFEKRKGLKEKTGFDVDAAIRHIEEEHEDDKERIEPNAPVRRVKSAEEAPQRRRRAPAPTSASTSSKYNVVKRTEVSTPESK